MHWRVATVSESDQSTGFSLQKVRLHERSSVPARPSRIGRNGILAGQTELV